ncbi:MAG: protein kinase [Byssovorax sp.]
MAMVNQDGAVFGIAAGTLIDGRYRVVRPIGQGGNGMVHEVEHTLTGRRLALKSLLDDAGLARLEQEARASALMKNGHAVKITDMGTNGPAGPYLVMELLDGQSLRDLLDEAGQLPLELTVNIVLQICECLAEAHGLGIIHRDLKPENVFLCASNWPGQYDVKVLDFGIVKIADAGPIPKSSLTRTGSTVGTPYYMSLEQLRNSSAVDARADIYSLGVVLYESLSGRKPFQAETIGDLVYALCSGPPTHLGRLRPDLPGDVCDLVMRTLSMNRDDRPSTMNDLAASLLPHGNAHFAMWMQIDGRTQTMSGPAPQRGVPAPRPSAPRAPIPTSTDIPAPVFAPPSFGGGLPPAPAAQVRTSPLGLPVPAPAPAQAPVPTGEWPSPAEPSHASGSSGRRDTPTEMYVKDAHGLPPIEEEEPNHGDRDTPTRAFRTDTADLPTGRIPPSALPPATSSQQHASQQHASQQHASQQHGAHQAAQQPGAPMPQNLYATGMGLPQVPTGPLQGSGIPAPTFGGGAVTQPMPDGRAFGGAQPEPQLTTGPLPAPGPLAPLEGRAAPLAPAKPAWQVSLDETIKRVEKFVEETIQKVKTSPPSTQIALVIAAGGAALLLLSLVLLLILR